MKFKATGLSSIEVSSLTWNATYQVRQVANIVGTDDCGDSDATTRWSRSRLQSIKRDIPFALRRGTIAQVTTHHHALDGFAWLRPPSARSSALVRG
jgi:hypothetical protein